MLPSSPTREEGEGEGVGYLDIKGLEGHAAPLPLPRSQGRGVGEAREQGGALLPSGNSSSSNTPPYPKATGSSSSTTTTTTPRGKARPTSLLLQREADPTIRPGRGTASSNPSKKGASAYGVDGAFSWINSKFSNLSALLSLSKREGLRSGTATAATVASASAGKKATGTSGLPSALGPGGKRSAALATPAAPHGNEGNGTRAAERAAPAPKSSANPMDWVFSPKRATPKPSAAGGRAAAYTTPAAGTPTPRLPALAPKLPPATLRQPSAPAYCTPTQKSISVADSAVALKSSSSLELLDTLSTAGSTPSAAIPAPPPKDAPKSTAGGEDESTKRHSMVVSLLSGERMLSDAFFERYEIGDLLGDGAFGFVMTARRLTDDREVGAPLPCSFCVPCPCSLTPLPHGASPTPRTQVAVKFIIREKIPKDSWIEYVDRGGARTCAPLEIHILSRLSHPNGVQYLEHFEERDYILLVTELHGTEWNVTNALLDPIRNPGLRQTSLPKSAHPEPGSPASPAHPAAAAAAISVPGSKEAVSIIECSPLFRLTPEQEKSIRRRTSCDLFECIDCHVRMPESTIRRIFAQIALAVDALHSKGGSGAVAYEPSFPACALAALSLREAGERAYTLLIPATHTHAHARTHTYTHTHTRHNRTRAPGREG
jgi:hypothetical protein